jgi:GTPase
MDVHPIYTNILNKIKFVFLKDNKLFRFPIQPNEVEVGNREYKINLDYSNKKHLNIKTVLNKKATQMNYRLIEGGGKAIYFLGVKDNGESTGIDLKKMITSLFFFSKIVLLSDGNYSKIRIYRGSSGYISTIRVTKQFEPSHLLLEI